MFAWLAVMLPLTVLALGLVYQWIGSIGDARRQPPPGRLVDGGAGPRHVYALGAGRPAVVFESGVAASSLNWRPVQEEVARVTRAVAYDRAGLGWSARRSGPKTASAAAADLRATLAAAEVAPPWVIVAHSFGGYIALHLALEHPAEVAGLVLVDPITPDDWCAPSRAERRLIAGARVLSLVGAGLAGLGVVRLCLARLGRGSDRLGRTVLGVFGVSASATVTRIVGEVAKLPPELRPAVQAHWSRPRSFLAMAGWVGGVPASARSLKAALAAAAGGPHDSAPPLGRTPLTVISGIGGRLPPRRGHAALARLSRRGRLIAPARGGHWLHLDEPGVVVAAVRETVETARREAAAADRSSPAAR